jgi:uncharacterized protein
LSAVAAREKLGSRSLVTTEAVLIEVLAAFSDRGAFFRQKTIEFLRSAQVQLDVEIELTHDLFEAGVHLYEQRPDKEYSLVDCISMVVMRERGILEVLTHDHHFEQEGFRLLL